MFDAPVVHVYTNCLNVALVYWCQLSGTMVDGFLLLVDVC